MTNFDIKRYNSIHEIAPATWDRIAAGRGFQSHQWYVFGEKAMADCPSTYLIAWDGDTPVGGAALFRVKNEPLPLPKVAREFMSSVLKRRPLLVCRSPLADTSALLLPGEPLRDEVLPALAGAAQEEFKKQRCSFLVFDYLLTEQLKYPSWPPGYEAITVSEPGTYMPMAWDGFEAYLEAGNKKDRQHYKRTLKETAENGIELSRHKTVADVEAALKLIENVSIWHGSAPNPWTRNLLENFSMIDGTWLELRKEGKLVGCGAVLRDNKFQLTSSLGLEDDVPGGYFLLLYAALQEAFEHKVRLVRFGSGAYDVKRRLGFHLEDTNHAMITMAGILSRAAKQLATQE
ncbi:MAG: GNAT family N-acetyltransferase [Anaerolineales bacterium]|nr:GNAT family N-acetyltransferase [Anaerolineales bacterium]NUQ85964.1 GNAT family N-acetyltransferase [Anaerolineales bacterium]